MPNIASLAVCVSLATLAMGAGRSVAQVAPSTAAQRGQFTGRLSPCTIPGVEEQVLCGRHEVFEDRSAKRGRTISLNIILLPATTADVLRDPLVFLAGGGVVPATRFAPMFARVVPTLRRNRDILLIDQRGSGASNALACDRRAMDSATTLPPDERYLRFIASCRDKLGAHADLRMYTTTLAMDDLDDVREWLGFPVLNLLGASYGTSAAQVYMRQHPGHARVAVLHGVVPLDAPMPLDLARTAQQTLEQVLRLCHDDDQCHRAFPQLDVDLAQILKATGTPEARQLRNILNDELTSIETIREIPFLIHRLAGGDSTVFEPQPPPPPPAGAAQVPPTAGGPPLGVRLAILCSEGLHRVDTTAIASQTTGTFLGDFPVRFQLRWCKGWPAATLPQEFWKPVVADTPTLLLDGTLDAVTPPAYAEHVKAGFANGQLVLLPNRSHNDLDPCVWGMIEAFVISGSRSSLDTSCLARTPSIAFRIAPPQSNE